MDMKSPGAHYFRPRYAIAVAMSIGAASPAAAQDATWLPNPGSGDFNTAANWTPAAGPGPPWAPNPRRRRFHHRGQRAPGRGPGRHRLLRRQQYHEPLVQRHHG